MKAIIGGTGVYDMGGACAGISQKVVETEYGNVDVQIAETQNDEYIVFLPRHGADHGVPPHEVNYRANMAALKMMGVTHVYATCAVGSLDENIRPGDIAVISDFIDQTKLRCTTFFDGDEGVKHVDMSDPYCKVLRNAFMEYVKSKKRKFYYDAVYVCTEGPRFETAAEIRMYQSMDAHLVGMTNVPEVVLAKELGIHYSAVAIVTNYCTGVAGDEITSHGIIESMERNKSFLTLAFTEILSTLNERCENHDVRCTCESSLIEL